MSSEYAVPYLLCAKCSRPLGDTQYYVRGLIYHPECKLEFSDEFSERQREQIRLIVLEVLRALRAGPVSGE